MFNDAIKSVTQDKERVIEDLRLRVELLTDETEKLRRLMHNAATESSDQIMTVLATENQSLKVKCLIFDRGHKSAMCNQFFFCSCQFYR